MSSDVAGDTRSKIAARYKNKGDLTRGEIKSHLIRLSLPMMWGIGAIISFQLVDLYFIGLLGTEALAAITFTFPVTFAVFSFSMGFSIAMSSVASRLIGEGRMADVQRVTTHGTVFMFILGIVISLIGLSILHPFFLFLGAPVHLLPIIEEYMVWWFLAGIFITVPMITNAAMRAQGDSFTPALIMSVVALVNVVLDPLLMFGYFGLPRLEVEGAAIATLIANAMAMLAGLYILFYRSHLLSMRYVRDVSLFGNSIKRLLFIALPAGLTQMVQPIVNAVIIALLADTGVAAVAAYGIVSRVEAFAFIVVMGVAVGMAPIIGQNFGANNGARVQEVLRLAIRFCVVYSFIVAFILILFGRYIAGLFDDNAHVIEYAVLFFMIVPLTYAFSNLVHGWGSAFNAMGMPHWSLMMIVVKMLLLMLPAVYFGYAYYGVTGLFLALAIVNMVAGMGFHLWAKRLSIKACGA